MNKHRLVLFLVSKLYQYNTRHEVTHDLRENVLLGYVIDFQIIFFP